MTEAERKERERLLRLIEELYELAPHIHLADSPSQARRLEILYDEVREVLAK